MSAAYNKVILLGHLTRDPETRTTAPSAGSGQAGGHTITKLGLAVNRKYSTRDGEQREEVTYIDVDAFGKQAEVLAKYMRKGKPIMVEGRLKFDQWETADGQKRSKLGVVLEQFQFTSTTSTSSGQAGDSAIDEEPPF